MKVIYFIGLPASGKTTQAKQIVNGSNGSIKRLNKDELRDMLNDGLFSKKNEKDIVTTERLLAERYLQKGQSVIIDNTGFSLVHRKFYEQLAKQHGADFEINDSFLSVPIETCIKRDLQRPKSVGENVIRDMYHKWIKKPPGSVEYDPDLPMAVIVDIDGTLAHMGDKRNPYDWSKVGGDEVDAGVAHLVDAIKCIGYAKVFLFSGRNEICRKETEEWLERHDIEYDSLEMRPKSRNEEDDRNIKRDMLEEHILGKYNVLFIVDDRPKVCRMWRDEFGFRVFNVGDPYYNF